jgi:hypothetical protein
VKFFDTLLGRTKQAQPDLERLFRLPSAAMELQASYGLRPTGNAGVCYKQMVGRSFAETHVEFRQLLGLGDEDGGTATVHEENDRYGYSWVVIGEPDFERLVNLIHLVNSSLEERGYGPQLLCSVFAFGVGGAGGGTLDSSTALAELDAEAVGVGAPAGTWTSASPAYVIYLFKQGTFYPFVPLAGEQRDLSAEEVLAEQLKGDLVIEKDLERRFPIWGVPVR